MTPPAQSLSPWTPLRQPDFRRVWTATVVSNVGSWMTNVAGGWLMTTLTDSPLLIAMMQVAMTLPFFLVGIPAGALADTFDRRKMLILTQAWMASASVGLTVFSFAGYMDPTLLLLLTFSLGLGNAMNAPVWQATLPELAGRDETPKAVALSGVGFNIARAIGPSLGGILVAAAGIGFTFLLDAVSYIGVFHALGKWKRTPPPSRGLPTERWLGAVRAGIRYVRHTPDLQTVLLRSSLFTLFASALWAMIPVVVKQRLHGGPREYGLLLGALGVGSLIAAMLLPRVTKRFSYDRRQQAAALFFAVGIVAMATVKNLWILLPLLVLAGIGWLTAMVSFNVATQLLAPQWVQARALSFYVLFSQGGLAVGSFLWGSFATHTSVETTLLVAAVGALGGLAAPLVLPITKILKDLDTASAGHDLDARLSAVADHDDGPVLVTIEYQIDPARAHEFLSAVKGLEPIRRRDGAIRWEIYRDLEQPGRWVEQFVVESWAEHLRQHTRMTRRDAEKQMHVRHFHLGPEKPKVAHCIFERIQRDPFRAWR